MSDYLWDKTGEPDEEVERLEAMLGDLGHKPRPLRLPAEAAPDARRPPRFLKTAWLAAAAALLLASLVGAAALLRARTAAEVKGVAAANETPRPQEGVRQDAPPAAREPARVAPNVVAKGASDGVVKDERAAVENFKPVTPGRKGVQLASLSRRRQKSTTPARGVASSGRAAGGASTFQAMSAGVGGAPSLFESTRLMAKEQLVYALRLTGAKLRDVSLKTQGRDSREAKQP